MDIGEDGADGAVVRFPQSGRRAWPPWPRMVSFSDDVSFSVIFPGEVHVEEKEREERIGGGRRE